MGKDRMDALRRRCVDAFYLHGEQYGEHFFALCACEEGMPDKDRGELLAQINATLNRRH